MAKCPNFCSTLDLSLDGIQESKSSSLSVDVYTVSFKNCRTVYPLKIIRPINKYKMDDQLILKQVLDDINLNECILRTVVCDNPKRCMIRCSLGHCACYACEYCESKAKYFKEPEKKRGRLTWPSSTANGPERTVEKIKVITDKIKNGDPMNRDDCKGFWGESHLLNQRNFCFINQIPAEYMHSGCLGVVKRLIEVTFNVGECRPRTLKRKLSDAADYNRLICLVQGVREFNRRFRNLDFGVLKAQEFRNIALFFFPIILHCIPEEYKQERKLWLQLTYILRSCSITNKEFDLIHDNIIESLGNSFYKNYEAVYGKSNCTYSIHLIAAHALKIRGEEPLTCKSAFLYENFYAELRNLFQPGTLSPSKQILQNCYMKRCLDYHVCEKSIFFDVEKNGRENNSLIYYIDDDNTYQFFRIIGKKNDNKFICNPQGRYVYKCDIMKDLDWSKVGVFKVGPYSNEKIVIDRSQIEGKVIKVMDFFITCPNNILREQ